MATRRRRLAAPRLFRHPRRAGRMPLTKRADSKITFPGVWTKLLAACSTAACPTRSTRHRSRRRLCDAGRTPRGARMEHELGIDRGAKSRTPTSAPRRTGYWAAGHAHVRRGAAWGEHEVAGVLFVQGRRRPAPNADEVSDARFLTADELRAMLTEADPKWSPWFVGTTERGGWECRRPWGARRCASAASTPTTASWNTSTRPPRRRRTAGRRTGGRRACASSRRSPTRRARARAATEGSPA